LKRLDSSPYQLPLIPSLRMRFGSTAGVHSTVWIFAITAALTRRAFWNRSSSAIAGYFDRSMSTMALCSLAKRVCRKERPRCQVRFTRPERSTPVLGSTGR
jgi:hypothetical protein